MIAKLNTRELLIQKKRQRVGVKRATSHIHAAGTCQWNTKTTGPTLSTVTLVEKMPGSVTTPSITSPTRRISLVVTGCERRVSFREAVEVVVDNSEPRSDDEMDATWYQPSDYTRFKQNLHDIIRRMHQHKQQRQQGQGQENKTKQR
jgi:hypothetical protein